MNDDASQPNGILVKNVCSDSNYLAVFRNFNGAAKLRFDKIFKPGNKVTPGGRLHGRNLFQICVKKFRMGH
jgi:hypothetical protein